MSKTAVSHKTCTNCGKYSTCLYKHIINPCDTWTANGEIRTYQRMARACVGKPMSRSDVDFIHNVQFTENWTPRRIDRLRMIHSRIFSK